LLEWADAIVERARSADGAVIIVNDRADVARLAGASGVHVGQDDLPPGAARQIVGPSAIVGLSTHSDAQVGAALEQPISYLAIGPVFDTTTKATGYDAVGLGRVRDTAAVVRARGVPLVAIGGITLDRAADVLRAGADSVCVISDLLATGDPAARVRDYLHELSKV
jgi:thiamine-phosphate pyrophosphorylase